MTPSPVPTQVNRRHMESAVVDTVPLSTPPGHDLFLSGSLWKQEYCWSLIASPSAFMLLPYLRPNAYPSTHTQTAGA